MNILKYFLYINYYIIKIYNKMEHYDNVTSKVYALNDKYKVQLNKNEGISKEALINIKYKMNQQIVKEKDKNSKLIEDNNKLQNKIKELERKSILIFNHIILYINLF